MQLISVYFILLFINVLHPIHVSITNIEYQPDKKVFDISCKLFADDFEAVIKQKYGVELKSGQPGELSDYKKYTYKYIAEHLSLKINNKEFNEEKLFFIKKKLNEEAVWLYFQYPFNNEIEHVTLTNTLMNDKFTDQTNLVIFTHFGLQKGYSLNNHDTTIDIDVKK